MHTKKRSSWMDDGDDAHFDGNPAYRKHSAKKHVAGNKGGVHKQGMSTVGGKKKTTRKRVAGK